MLIISLINDKIFSININQINYMTTKILGTSSDFSIPTQSHLPTPLSVVSQKTDDEAQKTLTLIQTSTPKRSRALFEADVPFTPTSSPTKRIVFPLSPRSPNKGPSEIVPTSAPKSKRNLFGSDFGMSKFEMPLPSFPIEAQVTQTYTPPPAPSKKQRPMAAVSVFKKQYDALCNGSFKYDVAYLAKGSYSSVYTLEGNEDLIIPGVNNSTLVLKAFHGEKSGFAERLLRGYLHDAIENYRAVVAAGLPVARIYNADTAEQDGYIIQQKVVGKVNPMNAQQMLQVRPFFEISINRGLVMDLMPQNFAFENGQVLLFDFVEDLDLDFDETVEDGIKIFHKKAIETWLDSYQKAGGLQDAAFLNGLVANHYQGFIEELLNRKA
jgi:hypothetical protein